MLKKLLSGILVMILVLGLSSCTSELGTTPAGNETKAPSANTSEALQTTAEAETDAPSGAPGGPSFLDDAEGLPETLSDPDIKIVYWYSPTQYTYDTSKNADVYDPILEAIPYYEERYGGKVTVVYSAWNDMLSTVTAMQNASEAPDLFEVYDQTFYGVVLSGVAQDLSPYTSAADFGYYDVRPDTFQWKGAYYAIPLKPYAFYFMFNRDLFDLEGLDAPDVLYRRGEWNWDTFRDYCKKMYKVRNGEVEQYSYGSWQDTILYFMHANGGSLLNIDTKTGTVTSNLDAPATMNTLDYLLEIKDTFIYGNEMLQLFDNGKLAMIRAKDYPVDVPFETGMVPFPTGDDYEGRNLVVYPQAMAIPTGAKNPEGAVAFMRIVNELQKEVGDQKEANRIGQANFDMIYAPDVKLAYNYDKCLNDVDHVVGTIINYLTDGVPAATINANMKSEIEAEISLMFGK